MQRNDHSHLYVIRPSCLRNQLVDRRRQTRDAAICCAVASVVLALLIWVVLS